MRYIFLFSLASIFALCWASCQSKEDYQRQLEIEQLANRVDTTFEIQYISEEDPRDTSLNRRKQQWITETVRAASYHLHTSDYEDVDDLVEEVTDQANDGLFETKIPYLTISANKHGGQQELVYYEKVEPWKLNQYQKVIYNELLAGDTKNAIKIGK